MGRISVIGILGLLVLVAAAGQAEAQSGWTREVDGVFIGGENISVKSMGVYNGALQAGTWSAQGGEVWSRGYSAPWLVWLQSNLDGFGDPNNAEVESMAEYNGTFTSFYVGTYSPFGPCRIWYDDPTFGWTQTGGDGLGDLNNHGAPSMAVFDGSLYVGTNNGNGLQIHKFTGITWPPPVVTGGFNDPNNTMALSMSAGGGRLYVGTLNAVNGPDIWYTEDGTNFLPHWDGGPDPNNSERCDALLALDNGVMAAYDGPGGVEIWSVGDSFAFQANQDGFGDANNWRTTSITEFNGKVYVATENFATGGQVWRMGATALDWRQVNVSGFGDSDNGGVNALTVLGDRLFAGTYNSTDGAEIWRYDGIFEDGFESGDLSWWSP